VEKPVAPGSVLSGKPVAPGSVLSGNQHWFISRDRRWYLIDVWRKRVDYPDLKAAVRTLASQYAAKRVLVEDTGAGISLVQELLGEIDGILAVKPERGLCGARRSV
jgi:phage terminase large subunit-like protein